MLSTLSEIVPNKTVVSPPLLPQFPRLAGRAKGGLRVATVHTRVGFGVSHWDSALLDRSGYSHRCHTGTWSHWIRNSIWNGATQLIGGLDFRGSRFRPHQRVVDASVRGGKWLDRYHITNNPEILFVSAQRSRGQDDLAPPKRGRISTLFPCVTKPVPLAATFKKIPVAGVIRSPRLTRRIRRALPPAAL